MHGRLITNSQPRLYLPWRLQLALTSVCPRRIFLGLIGLGHAILFLKWPYDLDGASLIFAVYP